MNCKVYHPNTPSFAVRFLVELGNKVNAAAESTTFLHIYRSTEQIESGFARKRTQNKWIVAAVGQGAMENFKIGYASTIFPERWANYSMYEKCWNFYRDAQKASPCEVRGGPSDMAAIGGSTQTSSVRSCLLLGPKRRIGPRCRLVSRIPMQVQTRRSSVLKQG